MPIKNHNIKIDEDLWLDARAKALKEHRQLQEVVTELLKQYVKGATTTKEGK